MKQSLFVIGLFLLIFVASCNLKKDYPPRTVKLNAYERFEHDTSRGFLFLKIVKIYPAQMSCINGRENYANLYITKQQNGQPLYVFECCQKVSDEAYDTTDRYPPILDTSAIEKKEQDSVVIFVPPDFTIPSGAKYVIAPIGFMVES